MADPVVAPAATGSRILAPVERLFDALTDPSRRTRTVAVLLIAFTAVWTLYFVLAHGGADVNWDVNEGILWSQDASFGHHPPVTAWAFAAWFGVFPRADWASYLLAATCIGLTLWISWLLLSDWLDDSKRVVGLAMLTLLPFYTFLASKLNTNTIMMPFWALTTLCFLRSFRHRSNSQALLAGAAGAAAVLSKYWSFYLIAGAGVAALLDPRRARYFRSPAPWLALAAGAALLVPHALDVLRNPRTLAWVAETGQQVGTVGALLRSLAYLRDCVAYALPAILVLVALRPRRAALSDIVAPSDADRRLVAVLFWVPLLLPPLVNVMAPHRLTSLWTFPNWSLLPVLLLATPLVTLQRRTAVRVLAVALALPLLAVIAAPLVALALHASGATDRSARNSLLAAATVEAWRASTGRPLKWVGGDKDQFEASAFYWPPGTRMLDDENNETIARDGAALVCPAVELGCVARIERLAQGAPSRKSEVELRRRYLGIDGRSARYVIIVIPPR